MGDSIFEAINSSRDSNFDECETSFHRLLPDGNIGVAAQPHEYMPEVDVLCSSQVSKHNVWTQTTRKSNTGLQNILDVDVDKTGSAIPNRPSDKEDHRMYAPTKIRLISSSSSSSGGYNVHRLLSLQSILSDGIFCRICHEGDSNEELIEPCKCSGTMGLMHRSCIETWLGSSNLNKCEICNHEFDTKRDQRPFTDWLHHPTSPQDRKNLIADSICFLFLTPLAIVSAWLCITGAVHYSEIEGENWESVGLIGLTCFLLLIYFVWCSVAIRYHYRIWLEWRECNQRVTVLSFNVHASNTSIDVNNNDTQSQSLSPTNPGPRCSASDVTQPSRQVNKLDVHLLPVVFVQDKKHLTNSNLAIPVYTNNLNKETLDVIMGKEKTLNLWKNSESVTIASNFSNQKQQSLPLLCPSQNDYSRLFSAPGLKDVKSLSPGYSNDIIASTPTKFHKVPSVINLHNVKSSPPSPIHFQDLSCDHLIATSFSDTTALLSSDKHRTHDKYILQETSV